LGIERSLFLHTKFEEIIKQMNYRIDVWDFSYRDLRGRLLVESPVLDKRFYQWVRFIRRLSILDIVVSSKKRDMLNKEDFDFFNNKIERKKLSRTWSKKFLPKKEKEN